MFDTVPSHICLFRCDFCLELFPLKGPPAALMNNRVYLVTEDASKYLKHYDYEESTHMRWVACCSDCRDNNCMSEYVFPVDRTIKIFYPSQHAQTFDALSRVMKSFSVTIHLKSQVMIAANFVGSRPAF